MSTRINKMLRFAVRKGYLETNPCSPIELAKNPNEKKVEMKYWTLEQFKLSVYAHWLPQADKGIAKFMDKDNALD